MKRGHGAEGERIREILRGAGNPQQMLAEAGQFLVELTGASRVTFLAKHQRGMEAVVTCPEGEDDVDASRVWTDWDIPRRTLDNRRIHVVESADQNPFVPRQLVELGPKYRSIALIPLYARHQPAGVVVLFAPRSLSDNILRRVTHEVALLSRLVGRSETVGVAEAKAAAKQPSVLNRIAAFEGEHESLQARIAELETRIEEEVANRVTAESFLQLERERAAALAEEKQALADELTQARDRAQEELEGVRSRIAELEEEKDAVLARGTEEQLAAARADLEKETALREELEARIARLDSEVVERERLEGELATARRENESLAERIEASRTEIERLENEAREARDAVEHATAELDRERSALEKARADLVATARDLDALRNQGSAADHKLETQSRTVAQLESRIADLERDVAAREERAARAEKERQAAETARQQADETHAALERELDALRQTASLDAKALEDARKAETAARGRVFDLEERLRALEEESRRAASLAEELGDVRTQKEQVAGDLESQAAALVDARNRAHELEAALREATRKAEEAEQLGQRVEESSTMLESLRGQLTAADDRARAIEQELATEREARAADRSAHDEELTRLRGELEQRERLVQEIEDRLELDTMEAEPEIELPIERSGDAAHGEADETDPGDFAIDREVSAHPISDEIRVGLLTGENEASAIIEAFESSEASPYRVNGAVEPAPSAWILNLAVPGSAGAVQRVRESDLPALAPVFAHATAQDGSRSAWLGRIDFEGVEPTSENLSRRLKRFHPELKRIMAIGHCVETMIGVRQSLRSAGFSAAVVLDPRQAAELIPVVRPEALVIHVARNDLGAVQTLATLREMDAARELPILFLIDDPATPETPFLSEAAVTALGHRLPVSAQDIVERTLREIESDFAEAES